MTIDLTAMGLTPVQIRTTWQPEPPRHLSEAEWQAYAADRSRF